MKAPQYRQRIDPEWNKVVDYMRLHIMRTMRSISAGHVDELDLEKLNNYLLQSLALVEHAGAKARAGAKLRAEFMSLIHESEYVRNVNKDAP